MEHGQRSGEFFGWLPNRVFSWTNSLGMRTAVLAISLIPDQLSLAAISRSLLATGMRSFTWGVGRLTAGMGSLGFGINNAWLPVVNQKPYHAYFKKSGESSIEDHFRGG